MATGVVFGVFDGLHEGHKYFLHEAATKCDKLFVVVATDAAVEVLKGRAPRHTYEERVRSIAELNPKLKILASDPIPSTWNILEEIKPDIVLLGYDQHAIAEELQKRGTLFEFLKPHRPEHYKSSLLN